MEILFVPILVSICLCVFQRGKAISIPLGNGREITLYTDEYTTPLDVCSLRFHDGAQVDDFNEHDMSSSIKVKMENINLTSKDKCLDSSQEIPVTKSQDSGQDVHVSDDLLDTDRKTQDPCSQPKPISKEQALQGLSNTIAYLQYSKLENEFVKYLQKVYECIKNEALDGGDDITDKFQIETGKINISDSDISQLTDTIPQNTVYLSMDQICQDGVLRDVSDFLSNGGSDITPVEVETVYDENATNGVNDFRRDTFDNGVANMNNVPSGKSLRHGAKFSCKHCGKRFNAKHYYKAHMQMHAGLNPYQCKTCGRSYGSITALRSHMIHHSNKTFVCDICGKSYSHPNNLQTHIRSHDEVKRHACPICGHRSALKCQYITHMRTHTDEKPYTCDICNINFTRSGGLLKHNKRKHPELVKRCIKTEPNLVNVS
jgi:predicted RNA-binding Zn-ribbon protein involved in translation (DUF1610 family)